MNSYNQRHKTTFEQVLPWLVLVVLLLYTYSKFVKHPYTGFRWDNTTGEIFEIYVERDSEPSLELGDRLLQAGSLRLQDFQDDLRMPIFEDIHAGDVVPLVVIRYGQELSIPWVIPGPNNLEIYHLINNEGWIAFIFWLAGLWTVLHLRPRDARWRLLTAFNFLTAIWLAAGSGNSAYHLWYSPFVLRSGVWLCVPVYLHLHWVFPKPLGKIPAPVVWGMYTGAIGLAIAEWFQVLPQTLYLLGFLVAISGSLLLLFAHAVFQAEARRDLWLLLVASILALIPAILLGIISAVSGLPAKAGAGMIGLPFIPLAYYYAVYRRQLGSLELRVNRFISIYIFLILLGLVTSPLVLSAYLQNATPESAVLTGIISTTLTALITIWGFRRFQSFIERRLLRISLSPETLLETYSTRIIASTTLSSLLRLIEQDVLPSLLVRQFAFLRFENNSLELLLAVGLTEQQIPGEREYSEIVALVERYRPPELISDESPYPWIMLVLPLRIGGDVIGLWLFGRRDPDDYYSLTEIPVLQSLANQTAIALSNILQTERLRNMYLANVNRYEEERLHLARELHDRILNQLAILQMNLDDPKPSQTFQVAYDGLTQRLREIVSDLRPPMLNYGLKPAIKELADNLMERSEDVIQIAVDLQSGGNRYPEKIELHLFRILQEACENALRHARAKNIRISGTLNAQEISLDLEDDGIGFEAGENLQLDALIANKHFGLAGMIERGAIIGAETRIESNPGKGTRIRITWKQVHG